ncbi:MAG: hypothetical protein M1817_002053 [Caeruleum heppii]|nr:MAG: hypothetical protein M1817_002053 [Caeruleum heppii]
MPSPRPTQLPSVRRQHLLVEFARLRHVRPRGVYLGLTPGDPTLWTGVLFVRQGPYAQAILRFRLTFPPTFPDQVPIITFTTDIFHPLLTPLTTRTYMTAVTLDGDPFRTSEDERMTPGGFSLRHGFPEHHQGLCREPTPSKHQLTVYEILSYVRSAFEDESLLDSVSLEAAGDPGAWRAWRSHRLRTKPVVSRPVIDNDAWSEPSDDSDDVDVTGSVVTDGRRVAPSTAEVRRPGEWNWEGVWEERVKKGIQASLAEPVLYGSLAGDDSIQFLNLDRDAIETIKENIKRSSRIEG